MPFNKRNICNLDKILQANKFQERTYHRPVTVWTKSLSKMYYYGLHENAVRAQRHRSPLTQLGNFGGLPFLTSHQVLKLSTLKINCSDLTKYVSFLLFIFRNRFWSPYRPYGTSHLLYAAAIIFNHFYFGSDVC